MKIKKCVCGRPAKYTIEENGIWKYKCEECIIPRSVISGKPINNQPPPSAIYAEYGFKL